MSVHFWMVKSRKKLYGCRTDRGGDEGVLELDALGGKSIDVGRGGESFAVDAEVRGHVLGENPENVRARLLRGGLVAGEQSGAGNDECEG